MNIVALFKVPQPGKAYLDIVAYLNKKRKYGTTYQDTTTYSIHNALQGNSKAWSLYTLLVKMHNHGWQHRSMPC